MKIIHIVPSISDIANGPSYSIPRLCNELKHIGLAISLVALDWGVKIPVQDYIRIFPAKKWLSKLGSSPLLRKWLSKEVDDSSITIIHNHGIWLIVNLYPLIFAAIKKYKVYVIVSPRGALSNYAMSKGLKLKPILWKIIFKPMLNFTTLFHATSYSEYLDIRRLGFYQPVSIIPNGVDIPSVLNRNQQNKRTILFIGRLHPIKGLDILLLSWKSIQDRFPEFQLRIVGPSVGEYYQKSTYYKYIKNLINSQGIKRVIFEGPLFNEQKWQAYKDADLFILTSHSENFGITVAESLACGTPVIVSKGAPWSELEKKGAGWWIDIGIEPTIIALKSALELPPELLKAMGQKGKTWMENEFSWEKIGHKMSETYHWSINQKLKAPTYIKYNEK